MNKCFFIAQNKMMYFICKGVIKIYLFIYLFIVSSFLLKDIFNKTFLRKDFKWNTNVLVGDLNSFLTKILVTLIYQDFENLLDMSLERSWKCCHFDWLILLSIIYNQNKCLFQIYETS